MLALLLALAQVPSPPCGAGLDCSFGGFRSYAPLYFGSGAPDFTCGMSDELPDGGWGPGSKYCVIRTEETAAYTGSHGDLTISARYPRSAGNLFSLENSYWGPAFAVFRVDHAGGVHSWSRFFANGNGAGVENESSYVAVRGQSTNPAVMGDVMLAPVVEHHDAGYLVDVWNGPVEAPFRVRDDGALSVNGAVLHVTTSNDGLNITQELPDGGCRTARMRWAR